MKVTQLEEAKVSLLSLQTCQLSDAIKNLIIK